MHRNTYMSVVYLVACVCVCLCVCVDAGGCNEWSLEGECAANPRYMWTHCLSSCMQHARDDHHLCGQWAIEGECSNNPGYVQVHCPQSCGYAVAWNPFTRRSLHIEPPDIVEGLMELTGQLCAEEGDIFFAAVTMHGRLSSVLRNSSYVGISLSSPSEFLLNYGLIEVALYSLRLYEIVADTAHANGVKERIQHTVEDIFAGLSYDSDALARRMMLMLSNLDTVKAEVQALLGESPKPIISEVARRYYPPSLPPPISVRMQNSEGRVAYKLNNDVAMPGMWLGTWQLMGSTCEEAVYSAIAAGFRAIDTAQAYGNELEVGRGIRRAIETGLVTRDELFVATKLSFEGDAGARTADLVHEQLDRLSLDYIDLYYLHSPLSSQELTASTWGVLEQLYSSGVLKALGVSNFNSRQLRDFLEATILSERKNAVSPSVVQNKFDVYHSGRQLDSEGDDILELCRQLGLVMVGYSPFSSFPFALLPLHDPLISAVASSPSHNRSASSVLLQWALQQGVGVLVRSTNLWHMEANLEAEKLVAQGVDVLSEEEIRLISSISNLVSSPFMRPNYVQP